MKKDFIIIADYAEHQKPLTLKEVAEVSKVSPDIIIEFVTYEIIHPQGPHPEEWIFDVNELIRLQKALRLKHDLEVNLPGIAIVLDLLDEVEELREHLSLLEKHMG